MTDAVHAPPEGTGNGFAPTVDAVNDDSSLAKVAASFVGVDADN